MILNARQWGSGGHGGPVIICLHGVAQHGGSFLELDRRLDGFDLIALDLRGHGKSGREPPWNIGTHVADVRETVEGLGRQPVAWLAHSFGARVALSLRAASPELVPNLILLEPALQVNARYALQKAEVERLDWSFASREGALRILAGGDVPETAHQAIRDFVEADLVTGEDHRFRFSFSPAAVVAAWSEMTLPVPPIAGADLLVIQSAQATAEGWNLNAAEQIAPAQIATVPHGHNIPWEAPDQAGSIIRTFLGSPALEAKGSTRRAPVEKAGAQDATIP